MSSLNNGVIPKIRRQRLLLVIGLPLLSLCLTLLYLNTFYKPQPIPAASVVTPSTQVEKPLVAEKTPLPVRLEIASIGIETLIKPAGLTVDGDMAVDDSIDSVAWYQSGPQPGEKGSAVIAGHYGWKGGQASIFNDLHTLRPGDRVTVYNERQTAFSFIVRETRAYEPKADATDVFRSTDGKAHLNLITCIGTWSNSQQTYSERLVVFTDMADPVRA